MTTTSTALPRRSSADRLQRLDSRPSSRRTWLTAQWAHREVMMMLARSEFQVRYKRAVFGVLWAVAVPAIQAAALAFVFSRFIRVRSGYSYPAYAVSAVLAWGYLNGVLSSGSTAIVDGAGLSDKVWFPRSLLVFVPCLANLPGLLISLVLLLIALPLLGAGLAAHTLLLVPAAALLIAFCTASVLVLSALHVYFRDVRYLVQAGLLVLFYITPAAYPQQSVGGIGAWMVLNPLTGIVNLFHAAAVGNVSAWASHFGLSIAISAAATLALLIAAIEAHRRHDRLFVDLL